MLRVQGHLKEPGRTHIQQLQYGIILNAFQSHFCLDRTELAARRPLAAPRSSKLGQGSSPPQEPSSALNLRFHLAAPITST